MPVDQLITEDPPNVALPHPAEPVITGLHLHADVVDLALVGLQIIPAVRPVAQHRLELTAVAEVGRIGGNARHLVARPARPRADADAVEGIAVKIQNKIGFSRQHYNRSAGQYNEAIAVFPANMIAGMFNFDRKDFFELDDTAQREVPKVKF